MTIKRERFLRYANEIKALGYTVFVVADEYWHYGYVINDKDQVGYFQLDDFGTGILFSTVHKPCLLMGGGIACDDWYNAHTSFTREIVDRCFVTVPQGFKCNPAERASIKKYSAKEWLELRSKSNATEITLL